MSYFDIKTEKNRTNSESSNGLLNDIYNSRNNSNTTYNSRSFVPSRRPKNEDKYNNSYHLTQSNPSERSPKASNGYEGVPLQKTVGSSVQSDLKTLRSCIRQFDSGEKRQWPKYLHDLTKLFTTSSFPRAVNEKSGRYSTLIILFFVKTFNLKKKNFQIQVILMSEKLKFQ